MLCAPPISALAVLDRGGLLGCAHIPRHGRELTEGESRRLEEIM
jgi:hypothetical protein